MHALQRTVAFVLLCLVARTSLPADAPDCSTFSWDMSHELELFAQPGTPLEVGTNAESAPGIDVDTVYALTLYSLHDVRLARAPGKTFTTGRGIGVGGVLILRVSTAGRYRISLDAPLWIDVIDAGQQIESTASQGHRPCTLIHKSVEWPLPANVDLVVQVTGDARRHAKLAVTSVPPSDVTIEE